MDKVVYNNDPNNANVSANVWTKGDHSFLNVTAESFVDVEKILLSIVFAITRTENEKIVENVLMRTTLNTCKINEGNRGNFIVKMMMDEIDRTADFKFTCPFPKVFIVMNYFIFQHFIFFQKVFHFTNFTPRERHLPLFLISDNNMYSMVLRFDGKLVGVKKVVNLFTLKLSGELSH